MVTPQTNTTLSEIAERLKALDDFVICGHVNPDGDCLGALLGLFNRKRIAYSCKYMFNKASRFYRS